MNVAAPVAELSQIDECRSAIFREIESGALKLPLMPEVAGKVITLTRNPDADLADFSSLIHRDQALAGHVLRIANSAAYAGNTTVVSLQQAVARLGMRLLSEIAITVSLQCESLRVPGFEREVSLIWRHAFAAGIYGREIARLKRFNVEGQFLCGLLHTVGKPVVLQAVRRWQETSRSLCPKNALPALLEEFHGSAGGMVCEKWKLPRQVQVSCLHYRNYREAPSFKNEATMTHLAGKLADWALDTGNVDEASLKAAPAFADLNLYPDEVEALLAEKTKVLEAVEAMHL